MFHLDGQDIAGLQLYLNSRPGSFGNQVVLRAEKPGEGNMNYVLRVTTPENSFIIKQSRPYVEKYPQIPAPSGRAEVEVAFYNAIRQDEVLKSYTPELLWADDINHIIALEDLGQSKDFSDIYKMQRKLSIEETTQLVLFINRLNNNVAKTNNPLLKNKAMRELNHQHIFQFPFMEDNGFNLDTVQSGLQLLAMKYKSDSVLKESIYLLGEIYLQDGNSLVHGDFYPGSWLHTDNGIKIIDPEFCFYGPDVFDLAILTSHCIMTQQDQTILDTIYSTHKPKADFDKPLYNKFTGIEILRRLIGLAQVPLTLSLNEKEVLLHKAAGLILN